MKAPQKNNKGDDSKKLSPFSYLLDDVLKEYAHKEYSNSIQLSKAMYGGVLLVPPALEKTAREVLEKHAAETFNGAFGSFWIDEKEERVTVDEAIDEQIKKLR